MAGPLKNARHEAFAQALAEGMSATRAYVAAGYKPNDGNSARLKGNDTVKARVSELIGKAEARTGVTLDRVLRHYEQIAFIGMSRFLHIGTDGEPVIDLSACTPADLDLLAEATVDDITDGNRSVRRIRIKLLDKMKALEALGRHLGMGDKTRVEATDRLTQALTEINARGSAAPIATAARLASDSE